MKQRINRLRQRWQENPPWLFALKALRYPFRPLLIPAATRAFKSQSQRPATFAENVRFVKGFKHGGITITP